MTEKSMFDLSGRVALVTAGGSGLGQEFCQAMAEFGADVACDDIDFKKAQEAVELIKKYGHRAIAIEADVSQQSQVERMVNQTVAEIGTIDILFANAGIAAPSIRIHEQPIEDWDKVMAVTLRGAFLCMRAVLPVMIKQQRGVIVTVSSVSGIAAALTVPNSGPYGAAKAGIIGLTKHAAVQYAKDGIRVNAIVPGAHKTSMPPFGLSPEYIEQLTNRMTSLTPMGRMGEARELKGLAVYLASDASSFVTGQAFVQDGGRTA